jgi:hypothetical protein
VCSLTREPRIWIATATACLKNKGVAVRENRHPFLAF